MSLQNWRKSPQSFAKKQGFEMGRLKQTQKALYAFARAIRELSEEDFQELMKSAHPRVGVSRVSRKPLASNRPKVDQSDFDRILSHLMVASTREIGVEIVNESFPRKDSLFAFAKFLDISVQRKDKIEWIRERIVSATVGAKLASQAIRGKPDQVALD